MVSTPSLKLLCDTEYSEATCSASSRCSGKVTYGQIEAALRWQDAFLRSQRSDGLLYNEDLSRDPKLIRECRAYRLRHAQRLFNFPALLPEMQVTVIKFLAYADLKVLE